MLFPDSEVIRWARTSLGVLGSEAELELSRFASVNGAKYAGSFIYNLVGDGHSDRLPQIN